MERDWLSFRRKSYGHECELQHVWITQKNRREIAAKLQQSVSRENILDTIRDSVGDQILQEHLTDDQDIKNIKKSFGIDTKASEWSE